MIHPLDATPMQSEEAMSKELIGLGSLPEAG